jgi:SAM-dependent methyltransferase
LRANRACGARVRASAAALPFVSGSFDLVSSNMVFEHLPTVHAPLAECHRVLRPGGQLVLHTPNGFDIVSLAARVVPNRWHPPLVSRLEQRAPEDVYPTYYRFNRLARIKPALAAEGFSRIDVQYLNHPEIYGHVPLLGPLERAWHRVARRVPWLRGTLLVQATRPESAEPSTARRGGEA